MVPQNTQKTMNSQNETIKLRSYDHFLVRWGGICAVLLFRIFSLPFKKIVFDNKLKTPISPNQKIVMVANHQKRLDPPAIFAKMRFKELYSYSPVKFLTWHRYYNSFLKPILYITGCFSTHHNAISGIDGSVYLIQHNYRVFIFPEGKRTIQAESNPRMGIVHILTRVPETRLILVRINWEPRTSWRKRPRITVCFADPPENLDKTDPQKIMAAVYSL